MTTSPMADRLEIAVSPLVELERAISRSCLVADQRAFNELVTHLGAPADLPPPALVNNLETHRDTSGKLALLPHTPAATELDTGQNPLLVPIEHLTDDDILKSFAARILEYTRTRRRAIAERIGSIGGGIGLATTVASQHVERLSPAGGHCVKALGASMITAGIAAFIHTRSHLQRPLPQPDLSDLRSPVRVIPDSMR